MMYQWAAHLHFQWTISPGGRRNHACQGNENFRAPGEKRTRELPHTRSDVLTTEPPGLYYTSWVYYTSVLGAECIAFLCSVSRVASATFSFLIFNDVLVSSTLTLPVNIFTWKKEKPCSTGARKLYILCTSTSLKIKKLKLAEATRDTEHTNSRSKLF